MGNLMAWLSRLLPPGRMVSYSFPGVAPGDYVVVETQPAGFDTVTDVDSTLPGDDVANGSAIDNAIPVSIASGETDDGNNFVEEQPGVIAGLITEDTNNDGEGEEPIAGVVVELFEDTNGDGQPDGAAIASTTTGTDGSYSFPGVAPGDYVVVETQPAGFDTVTDEDGTLPGDDVANGSATDNAIPVSIASGETDDGNNFVEEQPGVISGVVLEDTNNDDIGEDPIAGVTIQLFEDTNGDGLPDGGDVASTTTGTDGSYSFPNVPPGDYVIVETQPAGFNTVNDEDNTLPGDDSPNSSPSDNFIPVSLTSGETDDGNNFVEEQPGVIAGTITEDIDNDGVGEDPVGGVTVELFEDTDGDGIADGPAIASATTVADGSYSFPDVAPGDYVIVEAQPSGFLSVTDEDSTLPGDDVANGSTTDNAIPVTIESGETDDGNDFVEELPGIIAGSVVEFLGNSQGELQIEGVIIELFEDTDGDGIADGSAVATTTTDIAGNFAFENVVPGDYVIVETQPAGFDTVSDEDRTLPGDDIANGSSVDNAIPVTIVSGEFDDGNIFVEEEPGIIAGTVLQDTSGDGNGDTPIAGVTVELFEDADNDGQPDGPAIASTTTATNGSYNFSDVTPGEYVIVETQPLGFDTVADLDETDPGDDFSNISPTDNVIPVSIQSGETDDGNNFVEEPQGIVSGTVTQDIDGDESGDTPIAGVIVQLFEDTDGDGIADGPVVATTTTASDGSYSFPNVSSGDYVIVESQPAGLGTVTDEDITSPSDDIANSLSNDNAIPVTITPGETDDGNNFVEFALKSDSYSEFQAEFADVLGTENAPGDNPDGDIYNNALEYALCLHPGSGLESHGGFCLTKAPDGTVTAEFMRARGGLSDVTYILEGADTLGTPTAWTFIGSVNETVNTTDADVPIDAEKVLFNNLETASEFSDGTTAGVVRLGVEIDGVTYYTKSFGWQCHGYNDYECATFSTPFSEKPVYSGTFGNGALTLATDADGNVTLDVSDAASSDLTPVVGSNGEYYLQITSGALEGQRFDILNGGVGELTLVNDSDIFEETVATLNTMNGVPSDALLQGQTFEVIRFQTVDELFNPETTFAGEEDTDPNDFTRLLFYDSRSSTPGFEILGLVGTSTANSKWVLSNDLVAQTDQGGMRLDPCGGNWVHPKSSGDPANPSPTPIEVQSFGMIADHDQACAFNEGFNLTGAVYPFDQTPAGVSGRDLTVASNFEGGIDPDQATELLFWQGDTVVDDPLVMSYEEGYNNYMLLDGGGMQNWIDINDIALQNLDSVLVLESHRAVFLKIQPGDEKAAHIYPLPSF